MINEINKSLENFLKSKFKPKKINLKRIINQDFKKDMVELLK